MRTMVPAVGLLAFFVLALPEVSAHYLWVKIDQGKGAHGQAQIYFEEGPAPGDGSYLDHFLGKCKIWFRTVEQIEPQLLAAEEAKEEKKRWMTASLPASAPRGVDCYGKFGVYAYGETKVLLHYYARYLDVTTHEALHELARAEHLELDLVVHDHEEQVELTVLWQGKPAAGRMVSVRGPKQFRKNFQTNDQGEVEFTPDAPGQYTIHTMVEEDKPGREGDEAYSLIRHHGTLIMKLPLAK